MRWSCRGCEQETALHSVITHYSRAVRNSTSTSTVTMQVQPGLSMKYGSSQAKAGLKILPFVWHRVLSCFSFLGQSWFNGVFSSGNCAANTMGSRQAFRVELKLAAKAINRYKPSSDNFWQGKDCRDFCRKKLRPREKNVGSNSIRH